jgi:hypothetical protein
MNNLIPIVSICNETLYHKFVRNFLKSISVIRKHSFKSLMYNLKPMVIIAVGTALSYLF